MNGRLSDFYDIFIFFVENVERVLFMIGLYTQTEYSGRMASFDKFKHKQDLVC